MGMGRNLPFSMTTHLKYSILLRLSYLINLLSKLVTDFVIIDNIIYLCLCCLQKRSNKITLHRWWRQFHQRHMICAILPYIYIYIHHTHTIMCISSDAGCVKFGYFTHDMRDERCMLLTCYSRRRGGWLPRVPFQKAVGTFIVRYREMSKLGKKIMLSLRRIRM